MLRRSAFLLLAASACNGDDLPPLSSAPDQESPKPVRVPEEWEALDCAWEDRVDGAGGHDEAGPLALASDGGVVVGGSIHQSEDFIWVRRYSATGGVVWTTETAPGGRHAIARALALDRQDRVGLTGPIWDDDDWDFWVAEFEASGELAWSIDLDTGGNGEAACFAPTGELYVTGTILDPEDDSTLYATLIWVGKFAADGTLLWQDTQSGLQPGGTRGVALVCDESGGVVVLGQRVGAGSWIRRYDPAGEELWTTMIARTSAQQMLADPTRDGLLVSARLTDEPQVQLYRIDRADGAIASDSRGPDNEILAADAGGVLVNGHFSVRDPECREEDDCLYIYYYGYAYFDWDMELVWWRAEGTGVPDESLGQVNSLAAGDGVVAVAGCMQDDIWVCYR